ncbi:PqqD family protein [Ruegeria arenilitoris]|uniref:PqqD family protein n=1 Tax=Ruegeria arenilitoris TaxID=1173585 RepID=UPI00147B4BDD
MVDTQHVHFEGLDHPIALDGASKIAATMSTILTAWPHHMEPAKSDKEPFVTIRPAPRERWEVVCADAPESPRIWNEVNALCDVVAEMAWERLRSEPRLLCLHTAAVDFGGRLVVFPNARRAGKSTLAIALARLGLPIYTDDFLPIRVDDVTRECVGIANGVLPRLRLPVPEGFSNAFDEWVANNKGPSNRQYKYLADLPIAPWGAQLPLGAIVVLDRRDVPTHPELAAISHEEALAGLITQNFARTRHSGAILRSIDLISRHLPIYRLSYNSAEEAAEYLASHPKLSALPVARIADTMQNARQAPLDMLERGAADFLRDKNYVQTPGVTQTKAGEDRFLADQDGIGIFRLNPMSSAIWGLLEEPIELDEIIEILAAAFPDVARDQILTDCDRLMRELAKAQLIIPLEEDVVAQ